MALQFIADENFEGPVLKGLQRRQPELDIVRVIDVAALGEGASDPDILQWAADNDRIVLSHDFKTMINFATERVANNQKMPGLVMVKRDMHRNEAIGQLEILLTVNEADDFTSQIWYIPL